MASSGRHSATADAHVLAIFGPTASGKSAVAALLRERLGAEVISADAAALFADIPILTTAPDYPVQLVGTTPLEEDVSVGAYQPLAHAAIDAAATPLVVGGTGLYFRAALATFDLPPPGKRRTHWESEYERLGPDGAHALLLERDPKAAARIHANDRKRVIRALELAEIGSSLAPETNRLWTDDTRAPTTIVGLDLPLDELDRRVESRAREMVERGVVDEARAAWARPHSRTAGRVLGLEEFATLNAGDAVERVVQATRRLARYQRKWLRRLPRVVTLDGSRPAGKIADEIIALERSGEHLRRR